MTKPKLKREIWDETPFVLGMYKHKKNGKTAIARASKDPKNDWEIDKGKVVNHPIFRNMKQSVSEFGTGNYFFNRSLKDYEYVGHEEKEL